MTFYSIIAIIFSFALTLYVLPKWMFRAQKAGLLGFDLHKLDKREIPEVGGLTVIVGFLGGILVYIAFKVFIFNDITYIHIIFAALCSLLIATIIGLVDDILGWKIGLRQFHKALLSIAIAIPIMVINAGDSAMIFPFIGQINFGIIYPLLLIPLGIVATSNAFNMLAGYNGLEAGNGIIILSTLSLLAYLTGSYWVAILGACMVSSLIAFMFYNKYPSRVFPGDTLTYSVGALIGIIAILANIEKFAVILFLLYIIQFFLKLSGLMQKESFAKLAKDGSLLNKYDKIYGVEHLIIYLFKKFGRKVYEKEVVFVLYGLQSVLAIITLIYFFI